MTFSRANAKLVVLLSPADAASPLLAPLVLRMRLAGDAREVVQLLQLADEPGLTANALGGRDTSAAAAG